ncbi:MAG TPA: aminotransferase class V-fold PLP-dependent enzyme, partial [Polyangiaceae bacterium]|nr:aminotransferase class V-fold PLP-dependent enzyme [Polyangiaceae bacterium]
PANVTPWQLAAQARGARVELLPAPEPTRADASERVLEDLRAALRAGARYLAVSAVQFQTGFAMPIAELARLCHEFDALCFVDAIQALGGQPCDVESWGIDGLAGGAHKWMLGLEGAGFLYVRSEVRARLRPLTAGWLSHEEGESFLFEGAGRLRYDRPLKPTARVFEGSSINAVGCAALEAGFDVCRTVGAANIAAHVQGYHDRIEPEWQARGFRSLRAADSAGRSNILSFALPEGLALPELARELRARRIMVSTPDGYVRLAPHFANPHSEIDHVVDALDESLAALKR